VCEFFAGWFADTLATRPLAPNIVRAAYIDCDTVAGTRDALTGIVPALTDDGVVFSQDFAIRPVRELLTSNGTWSAIGLPEPRLKQMSDKLVSLRF
jgi:hypothetical protein